MSLVPPSARDAGRLRELFAVAGYTAAGLRELAGTEIPPPGYAPLYREVQPRVAQAAPLPLLVRWFFLGAPVEAVDAERVLPASTLEVMEECGLLRRQGDSLASAALITPCEDLWIASDLHQQRDSAEGREHVRSPSLVSLHLLNFMVRHPAGSVLDLCSGAGLHAVAAAGFAEEVMAADLNPRAAGFARFNAALNARENVECVTGDLFEGVRGQRFDLVVCNPPFVVSPAVEFLYKDNPMDLDEFCRQIVRTAPRHLGEGGLCQIICEWVELEGAPWQERLRSWFVETGCDAWVLEANRQLPENYARGRLREHATENEEQVLEGWTAYFTALGVRAIHGGLITLKRRAGDNWVSVGELRQQFQNPIGAAVLNGLEARDFLHLHQAEEQLLSAAPRVSANARIRQELKWSEGRWQPNSLVLSVEDGIPVSIGIDETVKQVLERFDGRRTTAEVLMALAGDDRQEADLARPQILALVRVMIENGCLVP